MAEPLKCPTCRSTHLLHFTNLHFCQNCHTEFTYSQMDDRYEVRVSPDTDRVDHDDFFYVHDEFDDAIKVI